jgi:hypothetical protein
MCAVDTMTAYTGMSMDDLASLGAGDVASLTTAESSQA